MNFWISGYRFNKLETTGQGLQTLHHSHISSCKVFQNHWLCLTCQVVNYKFYTTRVHISIFKIQLIFIVACICAVIERISMFTSHCNLFPSFRRVEIYKTGTNIYTLGSCLLHMYTAIGKRMRTLTEATHASTHLPYWRKKKSYTRLLLTLM